METNINKDNREELLKEKGDLEKRLEWFGAERNYEYFMIEERLDEVNKILEEI